MTDDLIRAEEKYREAMEDLARFERTMGIIMVVSGGLMLIGFLGLLLTVML
jgi:hypothetical protein